MITAEDIRRRLVERYPLADGWITMAEVTPPKVSRRFDLIAVMGWSSRGHEAMGFEIKVARGDWLAELKNPAKAEPLVRLCSRYWIAAPPGVVQEAELPPAWGLLVFHPEQVRTGRQAPRLECAPWDEAMWRCMLLRCATRERRTPDDLAAARAEGFKQGRETVEGFTKDDLARAEKEVQDLREIIRQAGKASGMSIGRFTDLEHLAEGCRLARLMQGGVSRSLADRLRVLADCLTGTVESMNKAADALHPAGGVDLNWSPRPSSLPDASARGASFAGEPPPASLPTAPCPDPTSAAP